MVQIGIKASWKDVREMVEYPGLGLVEVVLHENDLNENYKQLVENFFWAKTKGYRIVVHQPEYMYLGKEKRLVDISSVHSKVIKESRNVIARTIEFSEDIEAEAIIIHPGGISPQGVKKEEQMGVLKDTISRLGYKHFYLENMPWFYWMYNDEKWKSSIMVDVTDFLRIIDRVDGVCLDVCHAYLSNENGSMQMIKDYISYLGYKIKHMHISDAYPPDAEGLQIGYGKIDFVWLFSEIKKFGWEVGLVPEILDGHLQKGAGFKFALDLIKTNITT